MATFKQRRVIEKLVENGGNVTRAMRDVGYSEATINNPSNLTSSKGYREALATSGLTNDLIVENLVADIIQKPGRRERELTLASDILGLTKRGAIDGDSDEHKVRNEVADGMEREKALVYEEYLKAKLVGRASVSIAISSPIVRI